MSKRRTRIPHAASGRLGALTPTEFAMLKAQETQSPRTRPTLLMIGGKFGWTPPRLSATRESHLSRKVGFLAVSWCSRSAMNETPMQFEIFGGAKPTAPGSRRSHGQRPSVVSSTSSRLMCRHPRLKNFWSYATIVIQD